MTGLNHITRAGKDFNNPAGQRRIDTDEPFLIELDLPLVWSTVTRLRYSGCDGLYGRSRASGLTADLSAGILAGSSEIR